MIILPPNIRSFPFFLVISLIDKPVGRSIHVSALRLLSVFPLRGFILYDIHKKQGRSSSNSGYKIRKIYGVKIYSRSAPLAQKDKNRIFESKDGTTGIK